MQSLANQFLIAMPTLHDPNFEQGVTLICHHDVDGAMGIVVNKPLNLHLRQLLDEAGIDSHAMRIADTSAWFGGPVRVQQGFVLHEPCGDWAGTLPVSAALQLTTSRDILEAIGSGEVAPRCLVALGYAGWGAGQLEQEMADNAWVYAPASNEVLFATPAEERWQRAAQLAGIDLDRLTGLSGHA